VYSSQSYLYSDGECKTVSSEQTLPTTCVPVAQYPAGTQVAAQWFYGYVPYEASRAPTAAPTALPTVAVVSKASVSMSCMSFSTD